MIHFEKIKTETVRERRISVKLTQTQVCDILREAVAQQCNVRLTTRVQTQVTVTKTGDGSEFTVSLIEPDDTYDAACVEYPLPVGYRMTKAAGPHSYGAYRNAGWTHEQLCTQKFIEPLATPEAVPQPMPPKPKPVPLPRNEDASSVPGSPAPFIKLDAVPTASGEKIDTCGHAVPEQYGGTPTGLVLPCCLVRGHAGTHIARSTRCLKLVSAGSDPSRNALCQRPENHAGDCCA